MPFRIIFAAALLAALTSPAFAADEPAERRTGNRARSQSERECALTITWWEDPVLAEGEQLDLGIQGDKGVTRIWPAAMNPGGTILYEGPATVSIVRKAIVPDPSGKPGAKPIETWIPFASFPVGAEDREALAILFAADGTKSIKARVFNINVEKFPFGGFHVYNYTKGPILCSMAGKVFTAQPSMRTASPVVMTKREVVNFFLGVTDADGVQKLIFRAPLILTDKIRRLYFVMENPTGDSADRYVTHTMMQHVSGHKTVESMRGQDAPEAPKADPEGKKATKDSATEGATPKAK